VNCQFRICFFSLLAFVGLFGVVCLLTGCTVRVVPPAPLNDAVNVYILEYGRHPGLAFERADGEVVEYAYGEWQWFALNQAGVTGGMRAMLLSTDGALGRRTLAVNDPHATWQTMLAVQAVHPLQVERASAESLLASLDDRWEAHQDSAILNDVNGLKMVRIDEPYTMFNNSNIVLSRWLRELDCHVQGGLLFPTAWRVQPSPQP